MHNTSAMFEHYILGLPTQPLSFSPGALSNISPGTCLPPSTNSYFPLFSERRPSAHRLSSLDGLENALEKMEKGVEIEKDDVDTALCIAPECGEDMFVGDVVEPYEKEEQKNHTMMRRRHMRGKESRRMAMITDHIECGSLEQFVEEASRQQEGCTLAFRTRVKEAAEDYIPRSRTPQTLRVSGDTGTERTEAVDEVPAQLEEGVRSRSSSVNGPRAHWLKEYSSPIRRTHILERPKSSSVGNGSNGEGVLYARVHKKICQRRGM